LILLDTSGLLAALMPSQHHHRAAASARDEDEGPFLLSPFVLAEVDYFVSKWAGPSAELDVLAEVSRGAYLLEPFDADAVTQASKVIEAYPGLAISLADASIVVLAGRHSTNRVLTLDERHFRTLRTPAGEPFAILPADA
jgi:predicted nucleic acid-binding protein